MKRTFPTTAIVGCLSAAVIVVILYNILHWRQRDIAKQGSSESSQPHSAPDAPTQVSEHTAITYSARPNDAGRAANSGQRVAFSTNDVSRLLGILEDRSSGVAERAVAAEQLGKRREKGALEGFLRIVQDASEPILLKYKAARGLGVLGDERAVPVLAAILTDQATDNHLRVVSALALGNLGSESCVAALQRAGDDPDSMIRFKVVEALGRTRRQSALDFVEGAASDPDPYVQARAIHMLGELGDKSTVGTIRGILQTTPGDFIRIACLTSLGSMQEPESIALLHEYEHNTNELIRLNARTALQRLNQK
jgi:HEAT repeat protein